MLKLTAAIEDYHANHDTRAMRTHNGVSRRTLLTAATAWAGIELAASPALAQAQTAGLRPPTAEEIVGPFYPTRLPVDQDDDLTVIAGKQGRALGQVLYLSGRVTNRRGEPVQNAELEIWQANAAGRYAHPADENPAPLDANFRGLFKNPNGP